MPYPGGAGYFRTRVSECTPTPEIVLQSVPVMGVKFRLGSRCISPSSTFLAIKLPLAIIVNITRFGLLAFMACSACAALAGGSGSGVVPGARVVSGVVTEWPVPTPKYVRDPAVGPDGNIYFAVRSGDRIARFDPKSRAFKEWDLPAGMQPRGVVVAQDNKVIFVGGGNDSLGELDPASGKTRLYKLPSSGSDPYTLVLDEKGDAWFTQRKSGKVGKLDRASGVVSEFSIGPDPYSLSVDKRGIVWITHRLSDRIARLDPMTRQIAELQLGKGSQPRRSAVAPDGSLWVSLYGVGKVVKVDTAANRVVKEYALPGGANAGPYAVNTDAEGRVWISEIQTDSVTVLDPRTDAMRVVKLPTKDVGVRKAAIDAAGRYWYVGSHAGKLGVIE